MKLLMKYYVILLLLSNVEMFAKMLSKTTTELQNVILQESKENKTTTHPATTHPATTAESNIWMHVSIVIGIIFVLTVVVGGYYLYHKYHERQVRLSYLIGTSNLTSEPTKTPQKQIKRVLSARDRTKIYTEHDVHKIEERSKTSSSISAVDDSRRRDKSRKKKRYPPSDKYKGEKDFIDSPSSVIKHRSEKYYRKSSKKKRRRR